MKKLFDALHMTLGTLFMFGMPAAILGLSAWFGDTIMTMLHTGASAMHSVGFQLEAIAILFGCSAGGLALSSAIGVALWMVVTMLSRMAEAAEPLPQAAAGRIRVRSEPVTVGRIDHGTRARRS